MCGREVTWEKPHICRPEDLDKVNVTCSACGWIGKVGEMHTCNPKSQIKSPGHEHTCTAGPNTDGVSHTWVHSTDCIWDIVHPCFEHYIQAGVEDRAKKEDSRNPIYQEILTRMKTLHENKSHDYAQDSNVFSNFEIAGNLAALFKDPVDNSFVNLIGVKIARLSELLSGKSPKNESIEDTFIDLANYCAIWGSYRIKRARFIDDFVKKTRDEVK